MYIKHSCDYLSRSLLNDTHLVAQWSGLPVLHLCSMCTSSVLAVTPLGCALPCACGVCMQFDASMRLTADDFEGTRKAAMGAVRVPQHVIQLLADLRTYLQVGQGLCWIALVFD